MNMLQGGDHSGSGFGNQPHSGQMRFPHDFYQAAGSQIGTPPMITEKSELPACTSTGLYLLRDKVEPMAVSGNTNLLSHYNLETTYNKFCGGKKVKEPLSSFLPDLPGFIDTHAMQDNSSLKALIDRPPVGKEIQPLSQSQLSSFRLHPGPLPENYRAMYQSIDSSRRKNKHHKRHRSDIAQNPLAPDGEEFEHKKHKKKKHDDGDKKKKKKEKKKKRERDKERN